MEYSPRQLELVLKKAKKSFPAILVTGPRQSGKTTLLRQTLGESVRFVNLDIPENQQWAQQDPRDFLQNHPSPCIIDEIQYAPNLLPYLKQDIDAQRTAGKWFLTGSQQFSMMRGVSESLAGRIAVLTLLPFTISEASGRIHPSWQEWNTAWPQAKRVLPELNEALCNGLYPELVTGTVADRKLWYQSYIRTYLERDLHQEYDIGNMDSFQRFLSMVAARCGEILNMSTFASELGVAVTTIKRWLSILEASYIIFRLPAFSRNPGKRITKSPKLYFVDTGLAANLAGIHSGTILLRSALGGHFFENFVISDFYKATHNFSAAPRLSFLNYRKLWEMDLLLEQDLQIAALECKLAATIGASHLKAFPKLRTLLPETQPGGWLVCNAPEYQLRSGIGIVPWWGL